jgi:two-component system nitrogen regulation sensor histidine kinase NtrY
MEEKAAAGDPIDAATSKKFCDRMNEQVDALERLVNQFRSFSKAPDICPSDTDIASAIRGVADSMTGRLATDIEGASTIRTDPYLLNQIFLNIWKNAMEAGASRVTVRIEEAGGGCGLTIRDNGPGIAPELMDKIWLPYVSFKKGGTGLGLPVVKKLVETLGGTIQSTSTVGGSGSGLTLHLSLPAVRGAYEKGNAHEIHHTHR